MGLISRLFIVLFVCLGFTGVGWTRDFGSFWFSGFECCGFSDVVFALVPGGVVVVRKFVFWVLGLGWFCGVVSFGVLFV